MAKQEALKRPEGVCLECREREELRRIGELLSDEFRELVLKPHLDKTREPRLTAREALNLLLFDSLAEATSINVKVEELLAELMPEAAGLPHRARWLVEQARRLLGEQVALLSDAHEARQALAALLGVVVCRHSEHRAAGT
jgi:hypothetical protein